MSPDDPLANWFRLDAEKVRGLKKLGLLTMRDLLYHAPHRCERAGSFASIASLGTQGEKITLLGTIRNPETRIAWKSKRPMSEAMLEDATGSIKLMWFHQPYIAKTIYDGMPVKVSGRIEGTKTRYMANPTLERASEIPLPDDSLLGEAQEDGLYTMYPETKGVSSRWIRFALQRCFSHGAHTRVPDPVPDIVRTRYNLPSLADAFVFLHTPEKESDWEVARKRFSFEEIFVVQVAQQKLRAELAQEPSHRISDGETHARAFLARLPFALTKGQQDALSALLTDMAHPPAMSRLLEGDVGSGKTAVAAACAFAVVSHAPPSRPSARLQVGYMAPTEILAEQHFASFCELFRDTGVSLGLLTGTVCKKFPSKTDPKKATKIPRTQLRSFVSQGEVALLIGTHALIAESVAFRDCALVIIDEQHRFGVRQRKMLVRKNGTMPHLLSMTATPIPRTLALTLYGDLDLTVLDGMPPNRKKVITRVVEKAGRTAMYEAVRAELRAGRQAYVICPRIDEPDPKKADALQTKSVVLEAELLRTKELKGFRVALLHGKMKPSEKEAIMRDFLAHESDVLVATSVVEVGVNVPNATVILIEGAERFGLAQLHQLRGRVVRSEHQAYCFLLASSGGSTARLRALEKAKNGFELAEMDLALRGAGELYGINQSGMSDLGMEALKNMKMVEAARTEAQVLVQKDPTLAKHPALREALERQKDRLHFE